MGTTIGYGQNMKTINKKEEDWSRNLVSDMENLLDTGTLTDVTIKCDKKTIKVHKAVLSARSAVFRAMFQHDMRENKNNEIVIPDLDFATVSDMVKFIYSGRVKELADKYDIKDLKEICC